MEGPFWDEQTLDWYLRAADRGEYHAGLAQHLATWIPTGESVCDLGCGPGCLALALLQYVPALTALDWDRAALDRLRQRGGGHPGLTIVEGDAMALPPELVWDTLILNFFGQITRKGHLTYFLSHCRQRLLCVVSGGPGSGFSNTGQTIRKKEFAPQVAAFLAHSGLRWQQEELTLEFGQPLDSVEEARAFVRRYSPPACAASRTEAHLRAALRPLPEGGWYLPYRKRIGIFVIEKGAIP